MGDPRTFEPRLTAALRRYADRVPTDVDAVAFVRATRLASAPARSMWEPSRALPLALLLGLLGALTIAAAILIGDRPAPTPLGVTNGWIAYATGEGDANDAAHHDQWSDIYLVRVGEEPRLLIGGDGTTRNVCPGFSPDGAHLAYGEGSGPSSETLEREHRAIVVAALHPDGSIVDPAVRLAVAEAGAVPCPVWSPDWTRLAYADGDAIAVIGLDGRTARVEQPDAETRAARLKSGSFAWSPDGTGFAVALPTGTWSLRIDGEAPARLLSGYSESAEWWADVAVSWSPDGAWIGAEEMIFKLPCQDRRRARCRDTVVDYNHAYLLSADGQHETFDLGPRTGGPVWSPSGDRLVYWSEDGLVTANTDGSDAKVLPDWSGGPVMWSPDARSFLAWPSRGAASWDLYTFPASGPGGGTIVVGDIPTSGPRSWPGRGDITWQAVIP